MNIINLQNKKLKDTKEILNNENDDENDIYDITEFFNSENDDEDEKITIKDVNNPYYEQQRKLKEIYIFHKNSCL